MLLYPGASSFSKSAKTFPRAIIIGSFKVIVGLGLKLPESWAWVSVVLHVYEGLFVRFPGVRNLGFQRKKEVRLVL